jgi:hypothetical protein
MRDSVSTLQNAIKYLRRTKQMSDSILGSVLGSNKLEILSKFSIGDVVVHKSLGSQPLVVLAVNPDGSISVRYATQAQDRGTFFQSITFLSEELETPFESIEREGNLFRALNAKRAEIQELADEGGAQSRPIPINKLN